MIKKIFIISNFLLMTFLYAQSHLPVQLVYFNGTIIENNFVLLQWGTATETNNFGYNIERSEDQINWTVLGFVPGNGNSFSPKDYLFIDSSVFSGNYFYRLRQYDFDGAENLSDIVSVIIQSLKEYQNYPNSFYVHNAYPNPFNPSTTLQFDNPIPQRIKIGVYDIRGRLVKLLPDDFFSAGTNKIKIDLNHHSTGIYLIKIETKLNIYIQKIILIK